PGMTANVTIVTAKKESPLRVPNGALRFRMPNVPVDKNVSQVWVFDPENKTHQAGVTTGIADSLFTEIIEGPVKEGDRVILGIATPEEQAQKKLPPGFEPGRGMR
ncbi:MAG: efflux RND transporter periplasmic adaptor subunit, partial [Nitrospirota bacterium]